MKRLAVISQPDQMAVLRSPVRQEILDVIARWGRPLSLAETGALLGRASDGLYYHVRLLERAGLLASAGTRMQNGREEALYQAVAPQYKLRYPTGAARGSKALLAIVGSLLRLGMRDFRRALAGGKAKVDGPDRDLLALRQTGWLRPDQLRRVNRLIQKLADETAQNDPRGRLYAVSVVLAPLDHRSNRSGRRPRKRAGA